MKKNHVQCKNVLTVFLVGAWCDVSPLLLGTCTPVTVPGNVFVAAMAVRLISRDSSTLLPSEANESILVVWSNKLEDPAVALNPIEKIQKNTTKYYLKSCTKLVFI